MKFLTHIALSAAIMAAPGASAIKTVNLSDYGIVPNNGKDMSEKMAKALAKIKIECANEDSIVLQLKPGKYNFHAKKAEVHPYYISNHDQDGAKHVAINLSGWKHTTLNGNGADIICHGVILPVALTGSTNCSLTGFSIDFANPNISQIEILESTDNGIKFQPRSDVKYTIKDNRFVSYGEGWERRPNYGICFEKDTHRIIYNTSDTWCGVDSVIKLSGGVLYAPKWTNSKLTPGSIVALRGWERPAPGLFLSENRNTTIKNVTVHYADGMGLLAQLCENITLDGFKVALREGDNRYFTTQADATHFSGCKGSIVSVNGLYEGMMDDAINVHGTYLKVMKRESPNQVVARYMHEQTYGMPWGWQGDSVKVVNSATMDYCPDIYTIESIEAISPKELKITFTSPLPANLDLEQGVGLENITWTPSVLFANNTVRNNRARGSLFSTPQKVVVENNLYDHTTGSAILLSGDCNGWFETGACRDVTIRHNKFINALTSLFQFTEAVISIYPVIPGIDRQTTYFHGSDKGIVIENNEFVTFDHPLVYAVSVDGLKIINNRITHNHDYPAFHHNKYALRFKRVKNVIIAGNQNDSGELNTIIE